MKGKNKYNKINVDVVYNFPYCYLEKYEDIIEKEFLTFMQQKKREVILEYGKLKKGRSGIEEKTSCSCFGIIVEDGTSLRMNFTKNGKGCKCEIWEVNDKNEKLVKKYINQKYNQKQ